MSKTPVRLARKKGTLHHLVKVRKTGLNENLIKLHRSAAKSA
jgi:hypothetical protein